MIDERMADEKTVVNVTEMIVKRIKKWIASYKKEPVKHWQEVLMVDLVFKAIIDDSSETPKSGAGDLVFRREDFDYDDERGYYVVHHLASVVSYLNKRVTDKILADAYEETMTTKDDAMDTEVLDHLMTFDSFGTLNESAAKGMTTYTIVCRDPEGSIKNLIEYIKENGNTGHSFSIVVDPKSDNEKTFGWDGDGGDRIESVKSDRT